MWWKKTSLGPIGGILLVSLAVGGPAWSTTILSVNLPGLVEEADRIFLGRVVDEWTGRDENGLPSTITTFEITWVLKGPVPAELTIKQLGVARIQPDGLTTWVEGMPRYRIGSEFLLFLNRDSTLGFTSPIGFLQGAFEIQRAADGTVTALNGINNANLLLGLGPEELNQLGLSPETFPFLSLGRGLLNLEELLGMVERLQGTVRRTPK